jgi:hypothetical protein
MLRCKDNNYYIFWVCVCNLSYSSRYAYVPQYIVFCGLSGSATLFRIISLTARISGKSYWFSLQRLSETFLFLRRIQWAITSMYIGLQVKYPLHLSHFTETWIFRQIIEKFSNTKFRENPSSGNRVVPWEYTDTTKLIVALRSCTKVSKTTSWTLNFTKVP